MLSIPSDLNNIIEHIAQQGYAIVDNFMDSADIAALAQHARQLKANGEMRKASTGMNKTISEIRGDFIHWIDTNTTAPIEQGYLKAMQALQNALNQVFFLGLFELESHFAIYPAGTGYHKHLDQFIGQEERKITCILYLNEEWHSADGGELRVYLDKQNHDHFFDVMPIGGKLVVFVASDFIHEVLPAKRERTAITGWFRTRSERI